MVGGSKQDHIFKLLDDHCILAVSKIIKSYIRDLTNQITGYKFDNTTIDLYVLLNSDQEIYLDGHLLTRKEKEKIVAMLDILFS